MKKRAKLIRTTGRLAFVALIVFVFISYLTLRPAGAQVDPSETPTYTATATPTDTPVTPTDTATATPTDTPVTPTDTATATPTDTPVTPTDTATATPTDTPVTPSDTPTNTPTNTPVPPSATPTNTPTNTPPPSICPADARAFERTDIIGKGMGSNTSASATTKVFVPNPGDVLSIYGQLAGKEQRQYGYARFIRPNGTFINDHTKESPAYRQWAVFWFGEFLTPATSAHWRARLINAPTNSPFVQRAFILYPTYRTTQEYVSVWELFDESSENHVYYEWIPAQQQILELPAPLQPTSLTVTVAVVDNDKDNRPFRLTISAGTASQTVTLNNPTNGNQLNLVKVTLNNVPAGTSQVVLDLVSPTPNGDSVAMVGATAYYACPTP